MKQIQNNAECQKNMIRRNWWWQAVFMGLACGT